MILFLTSSPCVYNHSPGTLTEANGFALRLRAKLPPKPNTLFVASSPAEHEKSAFFSGDLAAAFIRSGVDVSCWKLLDDLTADQARELVAWSDFIILMGGHVPTQNEFFNRIGLKRLLEGYPGVVMGVSAGTMNAAGTVYAQPEEPGEWARPFRRFYPGLGLTHINICPHYQEVIEKNQCVDGTPIYPDITAHDSMGHTFHVFPDGTYLYRDEREYAIYGECWRFQDGVMTKLIENGGRIDLT